MLRWREAMERALYGVDGFFSRPGPGPAAHFQTSAHSLEFAEAIAALLERVDAALAHPPTLDVVDIGAGRGELLTALAPLVERPVRLVAVERAPRPAGLPATIDWVSEPPAGVTGLVLATEWLDNVPLDVATLKGFARYVLVDRDGSEELGPPVSNADAAWLARWWPLTEPGERAEIGAPRDAAWARAVATLERGLAVAVDYGHTRASRPPFGTLTGFRAGREVPPVPDGTCDLTAHVALDALGGTLLTQREALRGLGITGRRPPLSEATQNPRVYAAKLAAASRAAALLDPAGLGAHYWVLHPVGLPPLTPGDRGMCATMPW